MGILRTLTLGLLLCCAVVVRAETVPASPTAVGGSSAPGTFTYMASNSAYVVNSWVAACDLTRVAAGTTKGACTDSPEPALEGSADCGYEWGGGCSNRLATKIWTCPANYSKQGTVCKNTVIIYSCPDGQNWTLNGQSCTRPDCAPGETRNASGICESPCGSKAGQEAFAWLQYYTSGPSPWGPRCKDGCAVYQTGPVTHPTMNPAGDRYAGGGFYVDLMKTQWTGQACAVGDPGASTTAPPDKQPPSPKKPPPCSASEGVLTSSSGTVACVPEGTPGSNKPIVSKQKAVESFPDGSTKTTETTTTRDPGTGVETKTVSVSTTAATGGGTGQAGTPGTTTGPTTSSGTTTGGDPTKPGDSDFCAKNPSLQICKGGMNEEATQKKVQESLETAFNTDDVTNDEITNKQVDEAKKQEAEDAFEAIKDKLSGGTDASDKQAQFSDAVSTWFDPVPPGSCAPLSATVGGRVFTLDPCPIAQKVSDIGAYALWVYLAFGTLVLVTRKAE